MTETRSAVPTPLTSFIGRTALMDEARGLLSAARLVTLTGPGGVGKTRMALELARRAEADYDAVALADLAGLGAAQAVEPWLVTTLDVACRPGQSAAGALIEHLGDKHTLLVLDNCEHLWEAVGDVVTVLLAEVPELTVIGTSRRPFEITGEHVFPVPPLEIPPPDAGPEQAVRSDAVVLLLDRARAAGLPIAADRRWDAVVDLVRWSGGLPLVLELIAVRLGGGLSPATILQRLDGGRLLTGRDRRVSPRHGALWEVLEWSYQVCSPGERRLWARSSVFSGGFDLAMAEEVCADPDGGLATSDVIETLTGLVRQSMIVPDPDGRFRQLPPMREYGLRRLRASGDEERTYERHCALVRRLTADAARRSCAPSELASLHRVRREMPNIRTALTFCDTPERAETGLRVATDITALGFTFLATFLDEICAWLETFLAHPTVTPSPRRVKALVMLALVRLWQGDHDQAEARRRECLDLARRLTPADGDPPAVSFLEGMYLFLARGDSRCLVPLARAGDAFGAENAWGPLFRARIWTAIAAGFLAPHGVAGPAASVCLEDARSHGGPWSVSWALWAQGRASRARPDVAVPLLQQALRMMIDMGNQPLGAAMCVEAIAWEWAAHGHGLPAAELLGGSTGIQRSTGVAMGSLDPFQRERERALTRLRETLGGEVCDAALERGAGLGTDEVYTLALSDLPASRPSSRARVPRTALTGRQQRIAHLIAQGLSNKRIAEELHISQRTVENHIAQIFVRLGVHSRAQVAAWTIAHP